MMAEKLRSAQDAVASVDCQQPGCPREAESGLDWCRGHALNARISPSLRAQSVPSKTVLAVVWDEEKVGADVVAKSREVAAALSEDENVAEVRMQVGRDPDPEVETVDDPIGVMADVADVRNGDRLSVLAAELEESFLGMNEANERFQRATAAFVEHPAIEWMVNEFGPDWLSSWKDANKDGEADG